jgi:hypothetical protein
MAKVGEIFGDPAGFYGGYEGGEHAEDLAWMQEFGRAFGKRCKAAPGTKGNRVTPRVEAVRECLTERRFASRPAVSPIAKHLRRGFNNGYVIQRVSFSDGSGRYKDTPQKNDFSHVHDALQYLVLGLKKRGDGTDDLDDQRASAGAAAAMSISEPAISRADRALARNAVAERIATGRR